MTDLKTFSKQCRTVSYKFIELKKSEKLLADSFTPVMSRVGVAFLRDKIRLEGEGLPGRGGYESHPISEEWKAYKQKYAKGNTDHFATGATFDNLKILKRKSLKKYTIGLDEGVIVPHFGWFGQTGRTIKIGDYIKYISNGKKPRPLIFLAIVSFISKIFPKGEKALQEGRAAILKKKFGPRAIKEIVQKNTYKKDVNKILKHIVKKSSEGFSPQARGEV